ncbi:hypothetical protein [Streptomyces sp. NPDC000983]|uniref:hypothetical protein n=1 Tax=Streptomyces sp. NPDC000983 TaxID=3154373 RepID=UPI003329A654
MAFPAARTRYVRVNVTANTGWQAAQLSEPEVHSDRAEGSPPEANSRLPAHAG